MALDTVGECLAPYVVDQADPHLEREHGSIVRAHEHGSIVRAHGSGGGGFT
jgi:hypothetical protein